MNYLVLIRRLDRINIDSKQTSFGLKLLDLCKSNSLHIANSRLHEDCNYTNAHTMGSSVIDYVLLRQCNFGSINTFEVEFVLCLVRPCRN